MTAQPTRRSVAHAPGDLGDIVLGGRRRVVKAYALVRPLEDTVGGERM